ncbi:MAG TPA: carbohydrate-binding family 9-like protein [Flavisolibacter sp.]|nr:carbohydrate-binding family 9-like protein [Flavisolibacter sp.]
MGLLCVPYINMDETTEPTMLSALLDQPAKQALLHTPWPEYPYKPAVQFVLAYSGDSFLLKFFVAEKQIRSVATQINGPVWEDSCVEFFVAFDETGYYNFEFNCMGTPLCGFGKERNNRRLLPEERLRQIETVSLIQRSGDGACHWELTVRIPFAVCIHHQLSSLHGKTAKANFYKCGDALPEPHFVSWQPIHSPTPNFHLPQFFGELIFEK